MDRYIPLAPRAAARPPFDPAEWLVEEIPKPQTLQRSRPRDVLDSVHFNQDNAPPGTVFRDEPVVSPKLGGQTQQKRRRRGGLVELFA